MSYIYERNIVKVNSEYVTFLTDIITPLIYEGIVSIYHDSMNIEKQLIEKSKTDPTIEPQGILKLFQSCLKEVPNYNKNILDGETNRIKHGSKCYEWFDDLVKATIKSHILLLTCSSKTHKSESLDPKHYENVNTDDFIHKCYIESAKLFYNNPELFWHDLKPIKAKRNQKMIIDMIKKSIESAIRKSLPMKIILEDFLNNDPYDDNNIDINPFIPSSRIDNMKSRVNDDMNNKNNDNYGSYGVRGIHGAHGAHGEHGGDIRTSENGFEEVNNNNELSDGHMEDIQDRISKLGEAIEKNLGTHKKHHTTSSRSNSNNSQEIRDIVNDSMKRVGSIIDNDPTLKNKPISPVKYTHPNTMNDFKNIIGGNHEKIKSSSSSRKSNNSNNSDSSISSSSSTSKKSSSSNKSHSSNKSSNSNKLDHNKKHRLVSTEKNNFFANYLDD
jgi:hypothetical protein